MENNNLEKEYWGKSFYGSKLNTVLLLILIVLMIFALRFMYQNQGEYLPDLDSKISNNLVQENDEIYKGYREDVEFFDFDENGLPKNWIKWNDSILGVPVEKFGPVLDENNFLIKLKANLISNLPENKECIGDSESALCVVGENAGINRYFNYASNSY